MPRARNQRKQKERVGAVARVKRTAVKTNARKDNATASTTNTRSVNYLCRVCESGCSVCEKPCNDSFMCSACDVKKLREQFQNWTSGSKEIDAIIQKSQKTAYHYDYYWEWIEPKQFFNIKHLADGGFSSVYTATWIDGPRKIDNRFTNNEKRTRLQNTVVALKVPNVPDWSGNNNATAEFLNEVGECNVNQSMLIIPHYT